jgi:hypothetical protein
MPYQETCPVCRGSLDGRALLLDRDVWLHARCWQPSWLRHPQPLPTVDKERVAVAVGGR